MKRKLGAILMGLGALLVCCALGLFLWNQWEDDQAGESAQQVVSQLREVLPPPPTIEETIPVATIELEPDEPPEPMTEVVIDGHAYIGYVHIPAYDLELPVMADWSYRKLRTAPCRYAGSTKTDDLVLMAHNYKKHFGRIKSLRPGDTVRFIDMDGVITLYEVVEVETLGAQAVEEMTAGDYPLTLFTCTYGGKSRVAVRCDILEP